jgi:hypothetical protein
MAPSSKLVNVKCGGANVYRSRRVIFVVVVILVVRVTLFPSSWNYVQNERPARGAHAIELSNAAAIANANEAAPTKMMLHQHHLDINLLDKSRFALIMYDSRELHNGTYWFASARWNEAYCKRHGHQFVYYSENKTKKHCLHVSHSSYLNKTTRVELNPAWCKVKAMRRAQRELGDAGNVDFFIYVDSDAVIAKPFAHLPLNDLFLNMTRTTKRQQLHWNIKERPFVFNEEGNSRWCNSIIKPSPYFYCLNTGTVVWYSSPRAAQVLERWWQSALDPYEAEEVTPNNKKNLRYRFRKDGPWEQDRAEFLVHAYDSIASYIQVPPQPNQEELDITLGRKDWCLSHFNKLSNCFVTHFCLNKQNDKARMARLYTEYYSELYLNATSTQRNFNITVF